MFFKNIRFTGLLLFCILGFELSAQREYRAEIGISGGSAYYLGDANNVLFRNTKLTYGGYFRYLIDPRIALKAELSSSEISWDNTIAGNNIFALDATGEFNFFDLENNPNKRLSKVFSPYIFGGIGLTNYLNQGNQTFNMSIPIGVGLKVLLTKQVNLNLQWTNRIVMADDIEGIATLSNINNINGSNFTNNDILSTLTLGISINIWKSRCDCKNTSN